jgi:hypothetical protein
MYVASISQNRTTIILLLLIVGNKKMQSKISGVQGSEYEDDGFLEYNGV